MEHIIGAVLLIEDNWAIQELVCDCLTEEGYQVVTATTLTEALDHMSRECFGVILADAFYTTARGSTPWDGLGQIQMAARAPVVIFSAHLAELFDGWEARGFAGLISKPFDLDDLLAWLEVHFVGRCGGEGQGDRGAEPPEEVALEGSSSVACTPSGREVS